MSHLSTRNKRIAGGVLAGAMALSVAPVLSLTGTAFAADDPPPVAEPIGEGNVCEGAPNQEPFVDVTPADSSYDEIVCLFQADITKGKNTTPPTYDPAGTLTRREMALFLKRTADTADANDTGNNITALPAYDGTEDYPDIAAEGQAQKEAIGQLSQVQIALGFPDGTYRPGNTLTRRQMAKFVVREIQYLTGDTLTASGDYFDDDNGQDGEDEFNKLAEVGIFIGDGNGSVNPGGPLSRRQMANILLRTLQVLFENGDINGLFNAPAANAAVTVRPELLEANIVRTEATGTVIRFIFDEEITGTMAPVANLFHAYNQAGEQFDGSGTPTIESGGASALVTFANVDVDAEAKGLTVATVDFGAVQDDEASQNPIGDAPLGTSSSSTTTFTPRTTEAPDLRSVQTFRTDAADNTRTLVDFVFDENAFVVNDSGFFLVTTNGELIACIASDNPTTTGDTTDFAGDGTTAITTSCENTTVTGPISANEVARGYVTTGAVSDSDQPTNPVPAPGFPSGAPTGNLNPRQATDTPDASSTEPDLVSAELRFNADQTAGTQDTVLFTFSEAVVLTATGNPPVMTAAAAAGAQFRIYNDEATEINGQSAVRGATASQVLVTFNDGQIDRAVGASVNAGAVRGQTGTANRTNDVDEEGVTNSRTNSQTRTAGRTDNPDLTAVRIETSATNGDPQAVFVFDEDVDLVVGDDKFYLLLSSGTRLVCVDGNASNPTADDRDDTILCTSFAIADAAGAPTADIASEGQVRSAVAGSVDDDAVVGENDSPTATTNMTTDTSLAFGNPEGASVTTGGTGTPQT